ncbi:MAG: ABC-F family ATP-binding cassette domain-containing protein, partial [Flavicella sp.]
EKEIKAKEQLIEKFRAKANKASMAQSLIKQLDKVERIEVDVEDNAVMNVKFPVSKQPGRIVIETEGLSKSYGEKHVLDNVNLMIERSSKIAFVGQNGQGKSTLAKMMVNEIDYTGNIKLGHNVEIGYFAQNQAEYLDGELTLLETMENAANDSNRMRVRDMLGAFLFGGDDVDKKVKVLSGGERNRLAICKMLLSPFNVLIMDEPTNHLDIASKNVLKKALQQFGGTLILVSHDRDFLQGLTNTVYGFKDKFIKEYLGDIDYFLEAHKMESLREAEKRTKIVEKKVSKKEDYQLSRQQTKELKQLKNKLSKIERNIANIEKEIIAMDEELEQAYEATSSNPDFFKKYQERKDALDALMEEWSELDDQVTQFNSLSQ